MVTKKVTREQKILSSLHKILTHKNQTESSTQNKFNQKLQYTINPYHIHQYAPHDELSLLRSLCGFDTGCDPSKHLFKLADAFSAVGRLSKS
jgi:hypothetical protein